MPWKKLSILFITILALVAILVSCSPTQSDYVKVSFFVDGKSYESYWVKKGDVLAEEPQVPDKDGMSGVWSVVDFDDLQSDLRVDAIYSNVNCTISFKVDDAIFAKISVRKNSTPSVIPPVPEKIGFEGEWNYTNFSNIAQDITVTATYTPISYTVSFMNGNDLYATRTVHYGESVTNIPDLPSSAQHLSAKWVGENDTAPRFNDIKSDITIYAYYYISLELVHSYLTDSVVTFDLDEKVELIAVGDRPEYDFYGWYLDANLTQKVEFPYEFSQNSKLYARWLKTSSADDFTIVDGMITSYTGADTNVVVPYSYDDGEQVRLVTGIGENAFNNSKTITSISIPGTVTAFSTRSFSGLSALETLIFPDQNNVSTIGSYAFEKCYSLKAFVAGHHLEEIGANAFNDCNALSHLSLGNVKTIGDNAFSGIKKIPHIDIPSTVTAIGALAFQNMTDTTFAFPNGNNVVYVGNRAFENCYKLNAFVAPRLQSMGNYVFNGCQELESATMLSNIHLYRLFGTADMDNSYPISDGTTTYYIPQSLVNINIIANIGGEGILPGVMVENALVDAYYVKNVALYGNFTVIESHAFKLSDEQKITSLEFKISISSVDRIDAYAFWGRKDITSIHLPSSVKEINEYAFYELDKLSQVTIAQGSGLAHIGKYAFEGTKWLTDYDGIASLGSIAIGFGTDYIGTGGTTSLRYTDFAGLNAIAPYAFANNARLKEVFIPSNIVSIGDHAFAWCESLEKMEMAIECQNLGLDILSGCHALVSIKIGLSADLHKLFGSAEYDDAYTVLRDKEYYIPSSLSELTLLADGETQVRKDRYNGYTSLKTIILGEKITKIHDMAFADNTSLQSVTIPDSLVEIGVREDEQQSYGGAFFNCPDLVALNLQSASSNLAIIHERAFYNTSIAQVQMPAMVANIGAYAFANTKINLLSFVGGATDLSIGDYAFAETKSSVAYSIELPSNLVKIGEKAFFNNANLIGVTFTSQIKDIGNYAFAQCNLANFTLPSSVKLYDEENNCLVYGLLQANKNITELTLHNGITMSDLFISNYPNNLVKVTVNGGKIIDYQFQDMTTLQQVILNDITHIGNFAFDGCNNAYLVAIDIPHSVVEIGDNAFSNCTGLISLLNLNNSSLEKVGKNAFAGNIKLEQAIFPDTVVNTSWDGMFDGCISLSDTNIPQTVTVIGDNTFNNCYNLASIYIPVNIISIGESAFNNCYELVFENSNFEFLAYIGENAFANCHNLTALKAENIQEIGNGAFAGCDSIREITILDLPPTDYVDNVTHLSTINVSRYANTLWADSFTGCQNLVMIYFATDDSAKLDAMLTVIKKDKTAGKLTENVGIFILSTMYTELADKIASYEVAIYSYPTLFDIDCYLLDSESMTATLISSGNADGVLYIPRRVYDGDNEYLVTSIGADAFRNNQNITSVIIPSTILSVQSNAFNACANLLDVTFETGSRLKTIGSDAFEGCAQLASITIPDSVESIGAGAFNGCISLGYVGLSEHSHLLDIGMFAFTKTAWLNDYVGLAILNKIAVGYGETYGRENEITAITFADLDGVVAIAPSAFYGIYTLAHVEIPESMVSIGENAFAVSLVSVVFESTVNLSVGVFAQCENLQSISILSDNITDVNAMLNKLNQEYATDASNLIVYINEDIYQELSQEIELLELRVEIVS